MIRLLRAAAVTVRDARGTLAVRAGAAPYPLRNGGLVNVKWLVVHHTGAGSTRPTVEDVAHYQTGPTAQEEFPSIAYTFYVEADGSLVVCHDLEVETWSQGIGSPSQDANGLGINNEWGIAICFSGQDPTTQQWSAIGTTYTWLLHILPNHATLTGHRIVDPGTTECPGNAAVALLT